MASIFNEGQVQKKQSKVMISIVPALKVHQISAVIFVICESADSLDITLH
jgi:hypothetical protein